ncbi:pseudouridine synthase [Amylocystis lapponica]|nr:pseudouridine synthase [Amylocystis lapponica]
MLYASASIRPAARCAHSWAKHALYIDRGALVVNKPPGLVCQFDGQDSEEKSKDFRSLVDDIKDKFDLAGALYPVHRLDKATTGALALALTPAHARDLAQQFRSRTVEKTYLALVRGGFASFPQRMGTIRGGLEFADGRVSLYNSNERKTQGSERKLSETDWEVVAYSSTVPLTLVKLRPHTGLKHQLRVHMAHVLKTPILGDTLYSQSKLSSKITDVVDIARDYMYLHAAELSFFRYRPAGPRKRLRVTVGAPLPGSFVRLCARVGIPLHADLIQGGLRVDGERIDRRDARNAQEMELRERGEDEDEEDNKHDRLRSVGGRWLGG